MKKIILIAAIAVCSITSYAQISFGGQLGANIAMGHGKSDAPGASAYALTNNPKVGFLIGVLAQVDFGKLAFRPELNFVQKGSKSGYAVPGFTSSPDKITLNYIEVPLNVVYNLDLKVGKVFFGLGPAVAIGLSGKDKGTFVDDNGNTITEKQDVKFDGKKSDDWTGDDYKSSHLKRVDVGANILAGFQLPMGAFAKIGYTYGLLNVDPDKDNKNADDRSTYKNRGFSICLGYMIGGKKK